MNYTLYIELNFFTVLICLLLLWRNIKNKQNTYESRFFRWLLLLTCMIVILDTVSWLIEGRNGYSHRIIYFVVLELQFFIQIIPCIMMFRYTQKMTDKRNSMPKEILLIPLGIVFVIMTINILYPLVFKLNENNCFERLPGFYVISIIQGAYLISAPIICFKRYLNNRKEKIIKQYIIFIAFPIVGTIIQLMLYGFETIWMFATLGYIYIYINVQQNREREIRRELTSTKLQLVLGQLQYHFVFNTLATIEEYCEKDSLYAKEMLECFQKYLRYNLESINRKEKIHFTEELRHTKDYLKLEKMRFGDHINIVYDIEEEDFFLPVLIIQPVVERAVRYGICKRDEPGTLTIMTKRKEEKVYLTIEDNGKAKDADEVDIIELDNEELISIINVKKRLEVMDYGTLTYCARSGIGTKVSICLYI